jgi:predicted HNH restriction endonuclease
MSEHAIITENDESPYDDVTGDSYHYPERYRHILTPGCKVIYYKGRLRDKRFSSSRLSEDPHYFGTGKIGKAKPDSRAGRKDLRCEILNYVRFDKAVPNKVGAKYYEPAPKSKELAYGYWRTGVRSISEDVYRAILKAAGAAHAPTVVPAKAPATKGYDDELESYDGMEGRKRKMFSTRYERNPTHRLRAIKVHGLSCMACDFNFGAVYGSHGEGFIHVHHNKPLSETGEMTIDPLKDLSVLCPNCHAMVHKERSRTLSVSEVRTLIAKGRRA